MNKSLIRRLERLEARPVSPETTSRLRRQWLQTGIIPRAPVAALKLAIMFEAAIAEMDASVPSPDENEQRQKQDRARQLREMAKNPAPWMGREFRMKRR